MSVDHVKIGRAANAKGKRGEREAAEWFSKVTGVPWMRVPLSGGLRQDFPFDLMKKGIARNTETVFDRVGISIKNTAKVLMPSWIEEIKGECEDFYGNYNYKKWLIHFKVGSEAFITVPRDFLEELINTYKKQ